MSVCVCGAGGMSVHANMCGYVYVCGYVCNMKVCYVRSVSLYVITELKI